MRGNLYSYCCNNPGNYYDPSGHDCICLHQRVPANHVCNSQKEPSPSDIYGMFMDIADFFSDLAKYSVPKKIDAITRPNNIGKGTFDKLIRSYRQNFNSLMNKIDDFLGKIAYVGVALETSENICINMENNKSTQKIVWDATVDTVVLGANTFASAAISVTVVGVATPIAIGVGLVVGWAVDIVLDYLGDGTREYLKSWIG